MHEREQSRRVIVKGTRRWFTVARSSSQACREEEMRETELVANVLHHRPTFRFNSSLLGALVCTRNIFKIAFES